ncbi:MAG: hypothetical protein WA951_05670 [Leeuwenhoekiella sp.]
MIPKSVFTIFFIACLTLCNAQETTHLSGDVTVRLKKKELSANYELTNITVNSPKMSFMLHEDFDVDQVYLNGDPIASSKNGRDCETCKVHTIWIDRAITANDTLAIAVTGDMESFNGKRATIEAGSATKWYPVILDEESKKGDLRFASNTYAYTYDLQVKSADSKTVLIDAVTPSENNHFKSTIANSNIVLTLSSRDLGDLSSNLNSNGTSRNH